MPSPFQTRNIAHLTANYTTVKAVTASVALTSADTGQLIALDTSAGAVTLTLPAAEAGLRHTAQIWKTAADCDLIILAPAAANFIKGGVFWSDNNDADQQTSFVASDGNSNIRVTFDDPEVGTRIELVCDGTNWHLSGVVIDHSIPVFADS